MMEFYVIIKTYKKLFYINDILCLIFGFLVSVCSNIKPIQGPISSINRFVELFVPFFSIMLLFLKIIFGITLAIAIFYVVFDILAVLILKIDIRKTFILSRALRKFLKNDSKKYKIFKICHLFDGATVFMLKNGDATIVIPRKNADLQKEFDEVIRPKIRQQLSFDLGMSLPEIEETKNYYYFFVD